MQTEAKQDSDAADEAFLQQLILPEEDRRLLHSSTPYGGFRWFRSPNVIPIERCRQLKAQRQAVSDLQQDRR